MAAESIHRIDRMHEVSPSTTAEFAPEVPSAADPAALNSALDDAASDAALREELAKWRERVPKLAAALRQRTDECERLKTRLGQLAGESAPTAPAAIREEIRPEAGIAARDELISELESRFAALALQHKTAQGALHALELENAELLADLKNWKEKWQGVTRSLDQQAEALAAAERERARAQSDLDALQHRHAQLFETTEFANGQLEALLQTLDALRAERGARAGEVDALVADLQTLQAATLQSATGHTEAGAALEVALREIERLEDCVEAAARANAQREQERRVLSERLDGLETRNALLQKQLDDRSALVVNLEQDHTGRRQRMRELEERLADTEEALLRAERHAGEHAEHITQLDGKLERQKEYLLQLEAELAEGHELHGLVVKERNAELAVKDTELASLREQVRELESGLAQARQRRDSDDLTRIHGIGRRLADQLNELGIHRYQQIAELADVDLSSTDHALYPHKGRIQRDRWIEQAAQLMVRH